MHFSLLALLVSAATLVQSAPSFNGVDSKFSRNSLRDKMPVGNHVIRRADIGSNPVTLPISKGLAASCSGTAAAGFTQRVLVTPSFGGESAVFLGSGENVKLTVSPPDSQNEFLIVPQNEDYDLVIVFQFQNTSDPNAVFQNAFVNNEPTVEPNDGGGAGINIISEDSGENDDNDTTFTVVTFRA
ncbi:hypothetical protein BU17DRAFT_97139 [Hysterangium stoloniferum]|nr:hypothetical protein BU17DRAFT_97139 [Hysterangium stoloniferum]